MRALVRKPTGPTFAEKFILFPRSGASWTCQNSCSGLGAVGASLKISRIKIFSRSSEHGAENLFHTQSLENLPGRARCDFDGRDIVLPLYEKLQKVLGLMSARFGRGLGLLVQLLGFASQQPSAKMSKL